MKQILARISDELAQQLEAEAKKRNLSRNAVVILALEEYLNRREDKESSS